MLKTPFMADLTAVLVNNPGAKCQSFFDIMGDNVKIDRKLNLSGL